MTSRKLPERPNIEQLKHQAKSLLRAARTKDPAALQRFDALPAFAGKSVADLDPELLALHDAQSVIAREHGFESWNALREHVEERTLSFTAALEDFVRCATGGAPDRAERLLALHPAIRHANLYTELVLGEAEAVEERLQKSPEPASRAGGVQEWEPLLYICHTCMHHAVRGRADGLLAIARRLLELGANPNATYHWNWHPELPRTALWGALFGTALLPLAEMLLDAGADPTDGVSMHIAAGSGQMELLELLLRHGANVNGIPGGLPPLVYILGWSDNPSGPRWLLEHGADANLPWHETGESPLHVVARRWDCAMTELLVNHGADIHRPRANDGYTPHTLAELNGNLDIAEWLRAHGALDELSPLERFVAACARGDRAGAEAMLQARPSLKDELRPEHHLMLHRPAEAGNAAVIEAMLACGFDPRVTDKDGVTPLHKAAHAGCVDAVRALLEGGAPVNALDGMFSAMPMLWAAEGFSSHPETADRYIAVAQLLLAAGSAAHWDPPKDAPGPERVQEALADLVRAARINRSEFAPREVS